MIPRSHGYLEGYLEKTEWNSATALEVIVNMGFFSNLFLMTLLELMLTATMQLLSDSWPCMSLLRHMHIRNHGFLKKNEK
jgi:hypothetical protein